MSIRHSGRARRSFIIGSRLWPPATSRASGPWRSSSASACSTLVARSYSNGAGVCTWSPLWSSGSRPSPEGRPRSVARPDAGVDGHLSDRLGATIEPCPTWEDLGRDVPAERPDCGRGHDRGPEPHAGEAMTLTQLEAFVLVARLGSVKAAARVLGVSEPAVSGALAALRKHLGDPLVTSTSHGMELTSGGQRLVGIASQMVNLGAEAEAAIRHAQGAPELLRVVATSTIAEFVAPALVTAFTARVGPVEASVGLATAEEMPALLQERLADVALGPRLAELDSEPIMRYRLVLVASPTHRLVTTPSRVGARRRGRPRRAGLAGRRVGRRPGQRRRPAAGTPAGARPAHPGVPQPGGRVGRRGRRPRRGAGRRPPRAARGRPWRARCGCRSRARRSTCSGT